MAFSTSAPLDGKVVEKAPQGIAPHKGDGRHESPDNSTSFEANGLTESLKDEQLRPGSNDITDKDVGKTLKQRG